MEEALGSLPGVRGWIDEVVASLQAGRHVLVVTGGYVAPDAIVMLVRERCLAGSLDLLPLGLLASGSSALPEEVLAQACEVEDPGVFRPASIAEEESLSYPLVFGLSGVAQLTAPMATTWHTYFTQVARHGWASLHRLALFEERVPERVHQDLRGSPVAIHYLSELPSVLEVRLLCRLLSQGAALSFEQRWREAVLPGFAAPDLRLIERLWNPILGAWSGVVATLVDEAAKRGISPATVRDLDPSKPPTPTSEIAGRLWERGLLQRTPEHGDELSVLVLIAKEEEKELRHRAWRGQAALMLPMLDDLRIQACRTLTARLGPAWPLQYPNLGEDERSRALEDPLSTDYPPLYSVLKRNLRPGQTTRSSDDRLFEAVSHARGLRNKLAHYEPVEFSQFKKFCELRAALG